MTEKDAMEKQVEQDKTAARESGDDFRFRRRMLTRALTTRATWAGHRKHLNDALAALDKKTLTAKDKALILSALIQHKDIAEAYAEAGLHAQALFEIIDDAMKMRKNKNKNFAKMLDWPAGKRSKTHDHASITATYVLQLCLGVSSSDAVDNIARLFHLQSSGAVLKILQRNKKNISLFPLPDNWPKTKNTPK